MKNILIIEDNIALLENIAEMLEMEGYKVITALNGTTGLGLAKEKLPDLIISNFKMPGMNGRDVFSELKKDITTCQIPIVFMSSNVEKWNLDEAIENGVNGYIRKPFEEMELLDTIRHCLSGKIRFPI